MARTGNKWLLFLRFLMCVVLFEFLIVKNCTADWHPTAGVELEQSYDSNIYLRPSHETSDFETDLALSLGLTDEGMHRRFDAHYVFTSVTFKNHSDNNYIGHSGELRWNQQLSRAISWFLSERYYRTQEPIEQDPTITAVRQNRNEYSRNTAETGFSCEFRRLNSLTISYMDSRLQNKDPLIEDDQEYGPRVSLDYWFNEHHGITLGYSWERTEYERVAPRRIESVTTGYQWRSSPHLRIHLDYGLDMFSSEDPDEEDYNVHRLSAGFDQYVGPVWSLAGDVGIYYYDPYKGSQNTGASYTASVSRSFQHATVTLAGNGGVRYEYTDAEDRGLVKYRGITLSGSYSLSPKSRIHWTTSYLYEKSEGGEGYRYETWNTVLGPTYQILPWLSGSAEMSHRERTSSDPESEYRENFFILRLTALHQWF